MNDSGSQDGRSQDGSFRDGGFQITTRSEFRRALRLAFDHGARVGSRELLLCDPSFADWPLGESSVIASLTAWAGANRRLVLLAGHFDAIVRQHSRWITWRRSWSHLVQCRSHDELRPEQLPALFIAADTVCVQLVDPVRFAGRMSIDPREVLTCRRHIDAALQHSVDAFPLTPAGL